MTQSINFGTPLTRAPDSFEDSLQKLAQGGISSTLAFRIILWKRIQSIPR